MARKRLFKVSRRRGTAWGWLTIVVVLVLIGVGIAYSTGFWGDASTRTGSHAPATQLPPGAGPAGTAVANSDSHGDPARGDDK
jgi:hypothetical protein